MGDLKPRQATGRRGGRRLRQAVLGAGACLIVYCIFFVSSPPPPSSSPAARTREEPRSRRPLAPSLLASLNLTERQCADTFPGLTKSIDGIVAEGPFTVRDTGDLGPLQGRIKNGKIYIINAQRSSDLSTEMLNSRTAALHQLHRAVITSPEPLPDTIFALNFQDQPYGTAWGYSRAANPAHRPRGDPDARSFLMPHFSFWAWPLPFVGSLPRAAAAVDRLEARYPSLAAKEARAVWRGTSWYNSVHSPRLRQDLLAATRGRSWADVEALRWVGGGEKKNASNAMPIEDFCRYRYVLHTEGVAYSGRFQFLQLCASVTLTPPIQWMQHTTHLVRPVFAADLLRGERKQEQEEGEQGDRRRQRSLNSDAAARERAARRAWPTRHDAATEANIVFVAPDWSDLEATVAWLEAHPGVAQGIARRQRDLFAGGGYFSPAAEACYWRALVRGWAAVARPDEAAFRGREGVSYEAFSLGVSVDVDGGG